tara:strand:- start:8 stop:598 length:591 start_codon:yes stop_codon:yes gene_type:complete
MTDVLGGDSLPEIVERAKEIIDDSPDPMDPEEALRIAEIQEQEAKMREAAKAREKLQRARVRLRSNFTTREVDPFSRFDMTPTHPSDPKEKASEKQQAMLMNNGVDPTGLTRKQAGRLVADIMMRRKLGRPSLKQEALLTRYGLHATTAKQAKSLIDEIAEAGWKDPRASVRREPETGLLSSESAEGEGSLPEVDG